MTCLKLIYCLFAEKTEDMAKKKEKVNGCPESIGLGNISEFFYGKRKK